MHGRTAPGGIKRPPALPHHPIGHKPRILVVRMGFLENMIPIFPNLFIVIVIFTTQMRFMDCSFHVKYRRQAGLKSISWRAETLLH